MSRARCLPYELEGPPEERTFQEYRGFAGCARVRVLGSRRGLDIVPTRLRGSALGMGVAAILEGLVKPLPRTVCVLSGGNIEWDGLQELLGNGAT